MIWVDGFCFVVFCLFCLLCLCFLYHLLCFHLTLFASCHRFQATYYGLLVYIYETVIIQLLKNTHFRLWQSLQNIVYLFVRCRVHNHVQKWNWGSVSQKSYNGSPDCSQCKYPSRIIDYKLLVKQNPGRLLTVLLSHQSLGKVPFKLDFDSWGPCYATSNLILTKYTNICVFYTTASNQVSKTLSIDSEKSAESGTSSKPTETLDDVDEESDSDDEESMSREEVLRHQQEKKEKVRRW